VSRSQKLHGIAEHLGRSRDLGQNPAVRAAEAKLAVRLSIELIPLLVNRAMVPATLCRYRRKRQSRARFDSVVGPPCAQ